MDVSYTIHVDPSTSLVTMALSGFFDQAALLRFSAEQEEAYKQLRCRPNQHVTLCDVTECKLQSQEMVAGFQRLISEPRRRSRRLAFVVGSSLARMQIRRITAGRDDVRTFLDHEAAQAWLCECDDLQAPAISAAGRRA